MPLSLEALSRPLSAELILSKNVKLIAPYRVMQGFDIDKEGNIYYIQIGTLSGGKVDVTKAHELYIIKAQPNSEDVSNYMTLRYFGHGTNMTVEETNDGEVYVWVGSNANKNTETHEYWGCRSISRIKYEAGKVVSDGAEGDVFFLDSEDKIELQPAVDIENRRLAIVSRKGNNRHFSIFDLDEALSLSTEDFTFEVIFGGEESDVPQQTMNKTISGRNLSKLTPLADFAIPLGTDKNKDFSSYYMQGFDIVGDYIYFNEGDGNKNKIENGHSNDCVTVLDYQGNFVRPRTAVAALTDLKTLKDFGITDTGYMEGEGIKVKGSKLYLGFASRRDPKAEGGDNYRRANIFVYDCEE